MLLFQLHTKSYHMKKQFFTLIVATGLLLSFTSCEKKNPSTSSEETTAETTDGVGVKVEGFQKSNVDFNINNFGIDTAEFKMGTVATDGKMVYIVNNKMGNFSILVYNIETKKVVKTIKEWTFNGVSEKFMNEIRSLYIANGKLYATNIRYRVDVFNTENFEFITTLGSGRFLFDADGTQPNPNGLLASYSVVVTGGKVFIRDKTRLITFLESDVTPANYKKAPIFAAAVSTYFNSNDASLDIPMAVTPDGNVVISARNQKKLVFIDTKMVTKENGNWIDEARSVSNLPAAVEAVVATKDAYLMLMDGKIYKYTIATKVLKEIGSALAIAKNYHLYKNGDKVWLASENNKILVLNILNK